ncbi:hypothetical protein [Streptomyces sp. SID3343]|uniref:LppU/SCO3897 family protein n=1 Tax=Streptomyces sp. SID3343 TaxID=2690260 RepID=UPI00136CF2BF|nr:hypothetical protein [Streptomyces sp. SID3343]MYV98153.1 hypothetical protein [Streptomyces sp. SID3343]
MSNDAGSDENNPSPYIPAWSENTPPHGYPVLPESAPPRAPVVPAPRRIEGRAAARRAAAAVEPKPRGRGLLVVVLAVLLLGGIAGGAWWYLREDESLAVHEGDCLGNSTDFDQDPVPCEDADARFVVLELVRGTSFTGVCDSVPGSTIALASDPDERAVLCLAARK